VQGLDRDFGHRDFNRGYQGYRRRKSGKAAYLALLVCILAAAGMICYQKKIGPFAQSTLSHPRVTDSRTKEEARQDFDNLMNEIFKEEVTDNTITLNYTIKDKKAYDLDDEDTTLGGYSLEEFQNSLLVSENRVATLETFDYNKLSKEQQLIYDIVYIISKQNLESADFLEYAECLGPTTGIQAQLPVFLAEYNLYEKKDVEQYIGLIDLFIQQRINFI